MKGIIVDILKHMEAAFVVTLGLACAATYVLDTLPQARSGSRAAYSASAPTTGPMQVVVVSAKRMSEAEKRQSLRDEGAFATLRNALANRS